MMINEDIDENIFEYIRKSDAYTFLNSDEIVEV